MNITVIAINTAGLWYAYVSDINGSLYSAKTGFANREDAIADGNSWVFNYSKK